MAGISASILPAQESSGQGAAPAVRSSLFSQGSSSGETPSTPEVDGTSYAASLDGTGLIPVRPTRATHFMVGSAVSTGWDSHPGNLAGSTASAVSAFSPYLGLQSSSPRTQMVLQYQPTITRYGSSAYSTQTIQMGSLLYLTNLSERRSVEARANGSYGQNSARFVAPQQTVVIGGVPGTAPSSAAYPQNAGTASNFDSTLALRDKRSERDTLSLSVGDTFSKFAGVGAGNSVATASVSYERGLSPQLSLFTYGQAAFYYGSIRCEGYGGGVGMRWQFQAESFLSLSGGPQIDTAACKSQQGFSFNASLGTKLTGRSQLYLLASRQPTVSYLGGGLWQTTFSAGYERQIGIRGSLGVDFSHLASEMIPGTIQAVTAPPAAGASYSGTYFNTSYSRRLSHGFLASLTYRLAGGDLGGSSLTRNTVMFSVGWAPAAGHISQ